MPPEKEVIKQQMDQTRAALTEKLETLENQVIGTVHDTSSTVSNTVHNVGDTVRDTLHDVRATVNEVMASVRDALDVTRQIRRHPWLMMGGSVFAGYFGGRVLESVETGRFPPRASLSSQSEQFLPAGTEADRGSYESPAVPSHSGSSFLEALVGTFAPEIAKLKGMAVGAAVGLMRDKISEAVPPQFQQNLVDLMDRFTVKLGGEPTPPGAMLGKGEEAEEREGAEWNGRRI
jgi:ElaB/YqjD/DUF883 family membrane-anchored ribosome-binding protein